MTMSKPKPRVAGLWWKLSLAAAIAALLLVVFAHAVWTSVERGRVDRRVGALRAAKVPIDAKDLAEADVSDGANLVIPIRAAIAARAPEDNDRKSRRREIENDDPRAFEWPLTEAEVALLREELAANAAALKAIAGVDGRTGVAWRPPALAGPLIMRTDTEYNGARDVANLLGDAALLAARDGRGHDAAVAIGRILPIADAVGAKPAMIGALVGTGIHALAAARAIDVAAALDASPATPARTATAALIARLLDDASILRIARGGLVTERVMIHDTMSSIRSGALSLNGFSTTPAPGEQIAAIVVAPALYRSEGAVLDIYADAIEIVGEPDRAAYATRAGPLRARVAAANAGTMTTFARVMMPNAEGYATSTYRAITDRHLAATALAIRLYQLDHGGARPATLDALVPAYLPAVPTDAVDGRPLRYDAARAILWSVGDDGKDDGGDETPRRPNYVGYRWMMKDAVVPLTPRPRPATQPSE